MASVQKRTLFSHIIFYGSICLISAGMYLSGNVSEDKLIKDIQAQSTKSQVDFQSKKQMVDMINSMKDPTSKRIDVDKLLSKGKE